MKRFISSLCALSILFACTQEEPAPIRVESIELDSEELELIEGNSISLVATILPKDAENQNVIWSSSNKAVASVKDGEVTAVSVGEATITAKSEDGGKKATCVVTVNPKHIPVSAVSLDKKEVEMNPDDKVMLTATIAPENASNKSVLWSSSDESVATVKDGEVTALKVGEAMITATSEDGGKKTTCKVVVNAKHIPVSSVALDKEEVSLIIENKVTLMATVTPDNASNKTIVWISSDESVATVKDGEITALKVGEATITATSEDGGKKATCKVTVNAKPVPVTGVSLNKQNARVFINNELTLIATIAPEDATNKTLIWTTSNASVATVKNGVVKGISVGEADITVKTEDGNHSATCKVSVTEESQTQTKGPLTLDLGTVTSTTATFNGVLDVDMLGEYDMNAGGVGFIYAPVDQPLNIVTSTKVQISEVDSQGKFTHTLTGLKYNSEYHYAIFVYKNTICQYGETQVFETVPVDIELSVKDITQTRATISGCLTLPENDKELEVGILYSTESDPTVATEGVKKVLVTDIIDADGGFSHVAERLLFDNSHYYRYYVKQGDVYTYGSVQNFKTETVPGSISVSDITQTRATLSGRIELTEYNWIEVGVLYSQKSDLTVGASGVIKQKLIPDSSDNISYQAEKLQNATTYNYCYYACQNGKYIYGETKTFTTQSVSMNISVSDVALTTATFNGMVELTEEGLIEVGVLCSTGDNLTAGASGVIKKTLTTDLSGNVSGKVENLQFNTPYNYRYYVCQNRKYIYGETKTFATLNIVARDISASGTANCYIISEAGTYKIEGVKGNSNESVGEVTSARVLWESFGTDTTPNIGDLITWISCSITGHVVFEVPSDFNEGNAVIAVEDANGTILWSWHIWLTDQPQEQVYYNDAGTMMDRNLGATSATPGEVGALGLLYQWGRKDPFLGSSSISDGVEAKSTIPFPSAVSSNSSCGTIAYATANPTTFIMYNSDNYDWQYTQDHTRWQYDKTIYDPCPAGWRVPYGGVWSKAVGSSSYFDPYTGGMSYPYDGSNEGMNFSGKFGSASTIWYPASNDRGGRGDGALDDLGGVGLYWSVSPYYSAAYRLQCNVNNHVNPSDFGRRATGLSVRCIKENSGDGNDNGDDDSNIVKSAWGISGTFTNWGEQSDITMSIDGAYSVAIAVYLPLSAEFKFRKNNSWDTNYGGVSTDAIDSDVKQTAVSFGSNIKMKKTGFYDIYLSNDGKSFYVMTHGYKP